MSKQPISKPTHPTDVPYNLEDKAAVQAFWGGAIAHTGIEDLRRQRSSLTNSTASDAKKRVATSSASFQPETHPLKNQT